MRLVGGVGSLSLRELAVLEGYAQGLTVEEIGAELGITKATVKTYGNRLRRKLGASNKAEAVAIWLGHQGKRPA